MQMMNQIGCSAQNPQGWLGGPLERLSLGMMQSRMYNKCMDCCGGDEGLTILQVHKWRPSVVDLLRNLSEFRDGIISPSREVLLLHSYHNEALLLPLVKEKSRNKRDVECLDFRLAEASGTGDGPVTTGTSFRTSERVETDLTNETNFLGSGGHGFISAVHSFAWGRSEDTSNENDEVTFRELLFVPANCGVTVHAFRNTHTPRDPTKLTDEFNDAPGSWVDWGPPGDVSHNTDSKLTYDGSASAYHESRTNAGECEPSSSVDAPKDGMSSMGPTKLWLHTFFAKAKSVKMDGHLYTIFPERSSFPSSAEVISFSILGNDPLILEFLLEGNHVMHGKDSSVGGPDVVTCEIDSFYKCIRVFSSTSFCLVGFVLELMDKPDICGRKKTTIAVARLVSRGLQWVSSVMLHEGNDTAEWMDFKLTPNFLICLRKSGLIGFYGAISGEHIVSINLLHVSGFHHPLDGAVLKQNGHIINHGHSAVCCHENCDFSSSRSFKSLLIYSDYSLLGVVDELGVIYVINVADHIQGKHNSLRRPSPSQSFGCGVLAGWEVAGGEIGFQSVNKLEKICKNYSSRFCTEDEEVSSNQNTLGLLRSGLSGVVQVIDKKKWVDPQSSSNVLRHVFLPNARDNGDDVVSFSPFGITRLVRQWISQEQKKYKLVHSGLFVDITSNDDRVCSLQGWEAYTEEAVGCISQGCLYLVTRAGLSVVLPALSVSSSFFPIEAIGYRSSTSSNVSKKEVEDLLEFERLRKPWSPWKVEILDKVLLFESPEEADHLCLENGWSLRISRIRRLQLALHYLKFEEIKNSLEMLASIHLAEEGILRVIFAVAYLMSRKVSNDSDVSAASRLLALATSFAITMIREYDLLHEKKHLLDQKVGNIIPNTIEVDELECLRRMSDMAYFLEIIRNLQLKLHLKFRRVDAPKVLRLAADTDLMEEDDSKAPVASVGLSSLAANNHNSLVPVSENEESMALIPMIPIKNEASNVSEGSGPAKINFTLENPKDMIARWEIDDLDVRNIVADALHAGRLPLAVLKLHLLRSQEFATKKETDDTFSEVREVGRAIAYDFFLKGETSLAVATLQKLGEDIETSLKQLLLGTLRRSIRTQIAERMKAYGNLGAREWKMLENISLIERVYPCSSFWNTFSSRWNELKDEASSNMLEEIHLPLLHPLFKDLRIACGEVDGVILGSWTSLIGHPVSPEVDNDVSHSSYWTAAAVWSDTWDHLMINRLVLDQPFVMGVNILWESQLEYYMGHNDWMQISMLLEVLPLYAVSCGTLSIRLDSLHSRTVVEYGREISDNFTCSLDDLDGVCMNIPNIRIFRFPTNDTCSIWLRMLMEEQLAKKFVFLKDYWVGTEEIVPLLARSGFIIDIHDTLPLEEALNSSTDLVLSVTDAASHPDAVLALHKVLVQFCAQFNLMNLLDLYLDHHKLAVDEESFPLLQEAAGDNLWAKWLLLQRVKGREYEASFWNARAVTQHNFLPGNNVGQLEIDDIMITVDDIAEGAGEMAALATLMFAPIPIQACLSSGSINRNFNSGQCTLENLRPTLQRFPTLWRTLLAACFGQDPTCPMFGAKPKVSGYSDLMDYLNWRESIFFSSGRDTSLLQMLPCWFPKAVRRLIQLYVQGPLGWQSVDDYPMGGYSFNSEDHAEISTVSWESAIQKHIDKELSASSSEDTGPGLEHHLHRGRALAAFNHLLALRVAKWNKEKKGPSGTSVTGQTNAQSDIHALLAPITLSEESFLSEVVPLAIVHFEDSVLVASCALLLELCGLSASIMQIDIAALRRISSFYKSVEHQNTPTQLSPKHAVFRAKANEAAIAESLARTLADDYLRNDYSSCIKQRDPQNNDTRKLPTRALITVLQHLERASLPSFVDGVTAGSWLMTGNGDGAELRSQQKSASQNWNLVTVFCHLHQMPLSTKYLAYLARDNDWVGFLSEAQVGGYSTETIIDVASREFNDQRLKVHLLTVLKSMHSRNRVGSITISEAATTKFEADKPEGECEKPEASVADDNLYGSVELFGIVAECEKLKSPGEALLLKAKNLSWSILAMVAACFPDVSPLSCLAVWLEITAARETSAIKVNDVASQIANNVEAAVEATNSLPATARAISFHYNRRTPKRRRLIEPISGSSKPLAALDASSIYGTAKFEEIIAEGERGNDTDRDVDLSSSSNDVVDSLSRMVAVLCEQHLFLPLLKAFEIFLPSCSLLPFIRALQAFAQMRLSEASAHLGSFSARIKEEPLHLLTNIMREGPTTHLWICSTAVKAADAMISTCPSPYEKRCLLQLLASTDFGDDGSVATYYRQLYWKINLAEPLLRKDDCLHLGNETLDDDSLLTALINNGCWEQARNWARQLEASGGSWSSVVHHVTEMQAESMVAEWKEFLWDVQEERVALWGHCQTLFLRYSFPASRAGWFFLKHAEAAEMDLPARELHGLLLLSLQWLSGTITQSSQACPLNLLREIETKVWLLAVESEGQVKGEGEPGLIGREPPKGKNSNIDQTANVIARIDNHMSSWRMRAAERGDLRETTQTQLKTPQVIVDNFSAAAGNTKTKRRQKGFVSSRKPIGEVLDKSVESEGLACSENARDDAQLVDENRKFEASFSRWEESVGPAELKRAVLSLMEFGQITAAQQLHNKLSPGHTPAEFVILDAALKVAAISTPNSKVTVPLLGDEVCSLLRSYNLLGDYSEIDPLEVLENLAAILKEGSGRGLCKRVISVVKAANVLGLSFSEAFSKQPIELLQLLTLKAQESSVEARLLVETHSMPAASIAQVLAESFLKGLLAAHRGGYMDSQKDEGPAPLLWRFADFLKWAELCPSESEIGHALMRLVITGQEIPHACEVELLILSHHFYKSSACLDGVDVLVALAATRVEAYVSDGDFTCLARLITGVGNFHALNFILGILIENGQLNLLLQKYSAAADANAGTAEAVRGFRMAVLTSLQQYNPHDLDAFALVYNHFDMKHETAALLETRAEQSAEQWNFRYDRDQTDDLLESMRYFIEAAEVHSSIDAGNKTRKACAQASLVSLQIRMPDLQWLNLSETNARRALVEQSRFQEALVVAEAYGLNQPSEWALVLWNQMLKPELTEQFMAEFVAVLPLQPSMLTELARFYRAEVAARGDQSHFSVWLTGGGLPADWAKYLGRSFRCLLRRTRDMRLQLQLATTATGFSDVIDSCSKALDKVPDNAGPLVLRKGHGGAYLPLM